MVDNLPKRIISKIKTCSSLSQLREAMNHYKHLLDDNDIYNSILERCDYLKTLPLFHMDADDLLYDIEYLREVVMNTKKKRPPKRFAPKYRRDSFEKLSLNVDLSSENDLIDKTIKALFIAVYEKCKGNQTDVARVLGLAVRTVRKKLKEYNIYPRV